MSLRLQRIIATTVCLAWFVYVGFGSVFGAVAVLVGAVGLVICQKMSQIVDGRRERRRRLVFDADYQHAAWNAGDDRTAVYGRYQPQ